MHIVIGSKTRVQPQYEVLYAGPDAAAGREIGVKAAASKEYAAGFVRIILHAELYATPCSPLHVLTPKPAAPKAASAPEAPADPAPSAPAEPAPAEGTETDSDPSEPAETKKTGKKPKKT